MNRKRNLIIILILFIGLFPLIPIPMAKAYSKTVYITSDYDDVWVTETGNMFPSTSMVIMLDDETGLRSFLRFQNVQVARTVMINNATLYVYAGEVQPTSPGASVTIYGIDEPDCAPFSVGSGLWSLERPYTSSHVNWNLTSWSMGWHSVDVTNIIEEIINQYAWDIGNDLGFQILGVGDSGHEPRSFEDYYHPYRESQAKLTIVYDVIEEEEEPPGNGDVEFVEQYGEYTIWIVDPPGAFGYELIEYVFMDFFGDPYDIMYDNLYDPGPVLVSTTEASAGTAIMNQRKLVRMSNGTLYCVYHKRLATKYQIYIKKSENNGTTWTDETRISDYSGMENYDQTFPSIAVDSNDYLHVVWHGYASGFTTDEQIWYAKYTTSWATPVRLSTYPGMGDIGEGTYSQERASIAVDSNDYLHVVWEGPATGYPTWQVWYTKYTTSWATPVRISTYPGMENYWESSPTIAVDSNDYLHVAWYGYASGFTDGWQIWYAKYTTSWATPVRISIYAGMEDFDQAETSIAITSNDYIHVVWYGYVTGFGGYQIWYAKYTTSWATPVRISTYPGMNEYEQGSSTIAVDSDDYLHVVWDGKATGFTDYIKVWYANYTTNWAVPLCIQPTGMKHTANLRWSMWPLPAPDDYYIVTDENGTIIPTWNGDNYTDIDDLKDHIDDVIDPGGGDPLDPTPGTQGFPDEGPFTRFNMRLYFLVIGLGCIFGPLWAMGYKKLDSVGYAWCALLMILGTGLLWSITGI